MNVSLLIIAGGKSSRLGVDKRFAKSAAMNFAEKISPNKNLRGGLRMNVSLLIIAGGKSSRLGVDKRFVEVGGD